jgi:ABC-type proline/glycine betaine transport system substrate-binding protein
MKLCTAVIAAALLLAADAPARADEDCDTVVKALEDVQLVATKTLDQTMERDQEGDE